MERIDKRDVSTLRDLANKVAEIASHLEQGRRNTLWIKLNHLEKDRPPFNYHVEEFCWMEIMPDSVLQMVSTRARMHGQGVCQVLYEKSYWN